MKFDEKGDGPARYTILNYQKNPESNGYDYKVSHMLVPSAQIPGGALQLTNWGPTRSVSAFVCNLNVFGFFQIQKKIKTGLKTNMENMVTRFEPWDLFSNNLEITFNFCHYRQQFDASFPGFILQRGCGVDTVDGGLWQV